MNSHHKIYLNNAQNMSEIEDDSIHLAVTSPPYPMIAMWDGIFSAQNPEIALSLNAGSGQQAFELMHLELDKVWNELIRVLKPGGIACINIGDATRSINNDFRLYNNHSRITSFFTNNGLSNLPNIIWRKTTNAPNKFMGSGMLPSGAYVTLEHEHILIFRKGGKRIFTSEESKIRKESAFFWHERNSWFSDLWEIKGSSQKMANKSARERNGSYPFEIPYRLINMYSIKNDWVLDPFLGTGSTTMAAIASNRNSIGYEVDPLLKETIIGNFNKGSMSVINGYLIKRLDSHNRFVESKVYSNGKDHFKKYNASHQMPVVSNQESGLIINLIDKLTAQNGLGFEVSYNPKPAQGLNMFIEFPS
jgi:modification methylase